MRGPFWLFLLAVAAVVYGSLYPFDFSDTPKHGILGDLLDSLGTRPHRGDIVANLILYLPIGLFWALAFPGRSAGVRVVLGTLVGAAMSVGVEIAQIYDATRTPSLYDVALNSVSTLVGALVGHFAGNAIAGRGRFSLPDPAGALLAACWLAYRLFPFVPTIDFKQVKNALKPLLYEHNFAALPTVRQAVAWLAFASIAAAHTGGNGLLPLIAFAAIVLVAKLFIVGQVIGFNEVLGILAALALCLPLARRRVILGLALLVVLVLDGLAPFEIASTSRGFYFTPFIGFIKGSIGVAAIAVLAKAFFYGVAVWLLVRGGWRLVPATALTAAVLLAIEVAQTRMGRQGSIAEITDPLIAVLMAVVIALLPARGRARA